MLTLSNRVVAGAAVEEAATEEVADVVAPRRAKRSGVFPADVPMAVEDPTV